MPRQAAIDSYGGGGFRFGDYSHRGSLLALPSGMHAWDLAGPAALTADSVAPILAEAGRIEILLFGMGSDIAPLPRPLRERLLASGLNPDVMATGPAVRTYNVLVAEGRRVAAALIAVASPR